MKAMTESAAPNLGQESAPSNVRRMSLYDALLSKFLLTARVATTNEG